MMHSVTSMKVKRAYNTAGLFLCFGLGGDSFIVQGESYLKSQMQICNNTASIKKGVWMDR
ncbi:hypothetical protein Taiwan2_03100 [Helicobacter pylori]